MRFCFLLYFLLVAGCANNTPQATQASLVQGSEKKVRTEDFDDLRIIKNPTKRNNAIMEAVRSGRFKEAETYIAILTIVGRLPANNTPTTYDVLARGFASLSEDELTSENVGAYLFLLPDKASAEGTSYRERSVRIIQDSYNLTPRAVSILSCYQQDIDHEMPCRPDSFE